MIVTCPSCSARYKINDEKIKGKGAKITCLKCAHKFVVLKSDVPDNTLRDAPTPSANTSVDHTAPRADDIRHRDFRQVHVTWKVRKGIGLTYDFHDLATLLEYLEDEQVDPSDHLAYDARTWTQISTISDLEQHFRRVWDMAVAGRIPLLGIDHAMDEDESDAPTTIVRHGSNLADQIRRAVQEATEPEPTAGGAMGEVPGAPAPTAPLPDKRTPGLATDKPGAPDPFAGLKAKAQAEREPDRPSMTVVAFIVFAVLVLIAVLLMGLGLVPIPFAGKSASLPHTPQGVGFAVTTEVPPAQWHADSTA